MLIYIVDLDNDRMITEEFFNIANEEQLRRDLDDQYEHWFEDIFDALECLNGYEDE